MNAIHLSFENIIEPSTFINNFKDKEEFKQWLHTGLINDCKACLKAFENADMYEYCIIIQEVIDEKVDKMLSGFGFE
jgi:folate-dependent tRNA-U54 methylase TrmFO/GidA